jgi:EAL domain-containing protein (putative c-di-GMP-specific phosphodiesterase class I)
LADAMIAIVREEGIAPSRVEIEITEDAVMDDIAAAERAIETFRSSGMTIALDDFGTGYSSLSNLQRLKFDKLKIDRSFVKDLDRKPECEKLVEAIIGLALSLDMSITAEGIEDAGVAALLADRGCTLGQGWFFGRPVPLEELGTEAGVIESWAA